MLDALKNAGIKVDGDEESTESGKQEYTMGTLPFPYKGLYSKIRSYYGGNSDVEYSTEERIHFLKKVREDIKKAEAAEGVDISELYCVEDSVPEVVKANIKKVVLDKNLSWDNLQYDMYMVYNVARRELYFVSHAECAYWNHLTDSYYINNNTTNIKEVYKKYNNKYNSLEEIITDSLFIPLGIVGEKGYTAVTSGERLYLGYNIKQDKEVMKSLENWLSEGGVIKDDVYYIYKRSPKTKQYYLKRNLYRSPRKSK